MMVVYVMVSGLTTMGADFTGLVDPDSALFLFVGWLTLATLGTIGLWRVAIQHQFADRKNFCLLAAELVAVVPLVVNAIAKPVISGASTSPPPVSYLIFLGPVLVTLAYLVGMILIRIRARQN